MTAKKMARKKIKLGAEISPDIRAMMDKLHDTKGVSFTAMVDIALREYLARELGAQK